MAIFASAGLRFYIGGTLSLPGPLDDPILTEASFAGQTWVEIGSVETVGRIGGSAEMIDITPMRAGNPDHGYITRMKGLIDHGYMEITAAIDATDAGQAALRALERDPENYAFRVIFPDAPASGVDPTPSVRYFLGLLAGIEEVLDQANSVARIAARIAINSNIVRVAASAG